MEITGYILAGGKSSRMGTDKGLLSLNGKLFIEHIYDALKPLCKEIIVITANEEYKKLGFSCIEDIIPNKGPVGGIYTALQNTSTELNFIVSVDAPLVTTNFFEWLLSCHLAENNLTQPKSEDKIYPLTAIYNKNAKETFEKNLFENKLRVKEVIQQLKCETIEVPLQWKSQLTNINTREEYEQVVVNSHS